MLKNKTITGVVTTLLLLFFAVGVIHLFLLRFDAGDVYPAYSSLRSDPLGTRAFYESLENIDGISVRRNYHFLNSLTFDAQTTLLYLGASATDFHWVSADMMAVFDRLTQSGGRLVITFLPVTQKNEASGNRQRPQTKKTPNRKTDPKASADSQDNQPGDKSHPADPSRQDTDSGKEAGRRPESDHTQRRLVSIKKNWGVAMAFKDMLPVKDDQRLAVAATANRSDLPPRISWHTNLYFELIHGGWQTLYSFEGLPLIVERPLGKGSVLLCADSFFVSNEALWSERHPQLLVWLIGRHSNIIFDEAHFGIYKQPSVAQLIHRYRFHWFFAALAVLALLFVWKSAAYFVPPPTDEARQDGAVATEKDYTQGLVALLRRNITVNQILPLCAREWTQTYKKSKRFRPATFERIKELAGTGTAGPPRRRDPVKTYREIRKFIAEEKGYE